MYVDIFIDEMICLTFALKIVQFREEEKEGTDEIRYLGEGCN